MSNSRYDLGQGGVAPLDRSSTRLLYVSTAKYGGDWHSLLHTHTCTEIFYVVGGMGKFRIEELTLSVAVDDMIIVNPNVEHTEVSFNASPLEYIVMGVEGLEFAAGENGDDRYRLVNCGGGREDTLYYLRAMLSEIENKASGYDLVCQDLLEVLVVRLMRRTDFSLTPATPGTRTSKECVTVRRYIDSHFKESLSLDVLAEVAHVNKYYLVHTFSKEFGISPINYLLEKRIEHSRYLLKTTDYSVTQIAEASGFSSQNYFSQIFRKSTGMSPRQYRKHMAEEINGKKESMKMNPASHPKTDSTRHPDTDGKENMYEKEELFTCPQDRSKVIHKITFKKATCTRVPDTVLHFVCSRDPNCQECAEEYP